MTGSPPLVQGPPPIGSTSPAAAAPPIGAVAFPWASAGVRPDATAALAPLYGPAAEPLVAPERRAARSGYQPAKLPLRKLSPEEKAARRLRRNIITAMLGVAILMIVLRVLLWLSGG